MYEHITEVFMYVFMYEFVYKYENVKIVYFHVCMDVCKSKFIIEYVIKGLMYKKGYYDWC